MNLLRKLLGYCPYCRRYFKYPKKRCRNTAFVNEEENWLTSCEECYQVDYDAYEELWAEYNSGRL